MKIIKIFFDQCAFDDEALDDSEVHLTFARRLGHEISDERFDILVPIRARQLYLTHVYLCDEMGADMLPKPDTPDGM